MKKFIVREILPEFKGMKDVIKKTHTDGTVLYHTHEYPFTDEAWARGACKLNVVDNEFGHYMHLFNSKNETVGVYKMTSRLRGFTIQQLDRVMEGDLEAIIEALIHFDQSQKIAGEN